MSKPARKGISLRAAATLGVAGLLLMPPGPQAVAASDVDDAASTTAMRIVEDIGLWAGTGLTFSAPEDLAVGVAERGSPVLLEALHPKALEDSEDRESITPSAQASLIEATVELARILSGDEATVPVGQLLMTEAKAAADYSIVNLRDDDGRYSAMTADGGRTEPTAVGDARMLAALTHLEQALDGSDPTWPYADEPFRTWFADAATDAAAKATDLEPEGMVEAAIVIEALAAHHPTADRPLQERIASRIDELAASLPDDPRGALEVAYATSAHAAAAGTRAESADTAAGLLDDLAATVERTGGIRDVSTVTLDDLGRLLAALRSHAGTDGGEAAGRAHVALMESAAVGSGVLTAVAYEVDPAGGRSTARLPASAIEWSDDSWVAAEQPADLDAAMRLMTVLLSNREVSQASTGGGGSSTVPNPQEPRVIDVTATDFAFSTSDIVVAAGENVVIRLDNQGRVPHNIEAPDIGLFVEAAGGEVAEIAFTAPSEARDSDFICNLPGHADAGMVGAVSVTLEPASTPPPTTATTAPPTTVPPTSTGGATTEPGGPRVIKIVAAEFAFRPATFDVTHGEKVIIQLDNQGLVPHNIEAPDIGLFVEAAGGEVAEVALVVETSLRRTAYVCSIPGHSDAGMAGSITVSPAAVQPTPGGGAELGDAAITVAAMIFTSAVFIASMALAFAMVRFNGAYESRR
jgi:plastocyanin